VKVHAVIEGGTPESRAMYARVQRAIALTEALNRIPYADRDGIRAAWIELTESTVDESFHLIPPLYSDHGVNIRVGRNVFINQACILNDIGGIEIGDDVMIGPRVSLLSSGHPLDPERRRRQVVAAPIVIERGVWLGAGATILQGVTVGADAVVGAGAVVTRDVPARTLVVGAPAQVVRDVV
jgi:acetyltransferase-like isoleucine patch superfamily enzyme